MNKKFCITAICLMLCAVLFADSEQEILKEAFSDYSTPIVINYAIETPLFTKNASNVSFQEMTTISFTNISDQTIKAITFEYSVYDASHKQLYKNKITGKNVASFAISRNGVKNGKIEKAPLNKANTLRKKAIEAKSNIIEITKISIQFAKGKKDLSKAEIDACIYKSELDLYKDSQIKIKLQYNPFAKKCNIVTESAFENAYLNCKYETDGAEPTAVAKAEAVADDEEDSEDEDAEDIEAEDEEEIELDDEEAVAVKSTKKGSVYITEVPFDESEAEYAEELLIEYLDSDTADGLSPSAIQKKANRIIINDEEKLEQVKAFAAILNTIM